MTRKTAFLSLKFSLLFTAVILSLSKDASAFKLPDTGQTKCYQEVSPYAEIPCVGTGQDGVYNINPMSYTDNGDGTVTDNNTGLTWQQCSVGQNNDSTCSGTAAYYNWYVASGTYDNSYNPTSQDACGSLSLGGYTDWRLPKTIELESIIDNSRNYPAINPIFANTVSSYYWSSTSYSGYPDIAWYVHLLDGYISNLNKYAEVNIRCVRGQTLNFGNFVNNHNGTITDTSTGLMWQQNEPGIMTWDMALSYCEGLSIGNHSDWRLPNIKELESIIDDTVFDPLDHPIAIDTNAFPNAHASYYWASTTLVEHPHFAWIVAFWDGNVYGRDKRGEYDDYYVRCVRGGQTLFEEITPAITYNGTWASHHCASCSGDALKYSSDKATPAKATFSFNGTGIKWIYAKAKNLGKAKVYLDGVYKGVIDQYSSTTKFKQSLQKTGLLAGNHTLAIEVSGRKNLLSSGYIIDIDAFEVVP